MIHETPLTKEERDRLVRIIDEMILVLQHMKLTYGLTQYPELTDTLFASSKFNQSI